MLKIVYLLNQEALASAFSRF